MATPTEGGGSIPGDLPPGYSGLPTPPYVPGSGFAGVVNSFGQLAKLVETTLPYLARRLAFGVDYYRNTDRRF